MRKADFEAALFQSSATPASAIRNGSRSLLCPRAIGRFSVAEKALKKDYSFHIFRLQSAYARNYSLEKKRLR